MNEAPVRYERWTKDCSCMATSTTGQIRYEDGGPKVIDGREHYTFNMNFYPGPSCDRCGKPWKEA